MAVLARAEVPEAQRWNAESVFVSLEAWDEAFEAVEQALTRASDFQNQLDSPDALKTWFAYREDVLSQLGKLRVYAGMAYNTDSLDADAAARNDRIRGLYSKVGEAFAFAEPELLGLDKEEVTGWLRDDPDLAVYQHYFERLWQGAPHVRSAEVEALLGALGDPFGTATSAHGVLANTDLPFEDARDSKGDAHEITQGTISKLLFSPDRTLRQNAYENYADAHLRAKQTMTTILSAGIKQNVFLARARRYDSALHAALEPENLPLSVFHSLIDTFKANLPTWHRYWRAKRKRLGVEQLHPYDTFAPMTSKSPEITFEQSVDWLSETLAPLGDEYVETMRKGSLEQRWVDRSVNKGKRMGAFSNGVQGTHPFIMMSYTDNVLGMSTLAHELGHSLHSYFTWQTQPQVYTHYSMFVAEVASNFNQAVLRDYLFKQQDDPDFQITLIEEAMANFYRYFFVMPTLARFELEIHERTARGQSLSADSLIELMSNLFAEGYGDEMVMDRERVGITWAQFHTHLYARFYVYQYATGISGAHALAKGIIEGENGAAEKYLEFLKTGSSKYPLDALKDAGVDLSTPQPVAETFEVLAGLVERLETLSEA